jgi:hypothetical protein
MELLGLAAQEIGNTDLRVGGVMFEGGGGLGKLAVTQSLTPFDLHLPAYSTANDALMTRGKRRVGE